MRYAKWSLIVGICLLIPVTLFLPLSHAARAPQGNALMPKHGGPTKQSVLPGPPETATDLRSFSENESQPLGSELSSRWAKASQLSTASDTASPSLAPDTGAHSSGNTQVTAKGIAPQELKPASTDLLLPPTDQTCPPPLIHGTIGQDSQDYPGSSGVQTGRLSQNGVNSSCGSPKTTPSIASPGISFAYDSYQFTNDSSSAACVTFTFAQSCGINQAVHPVVYLNSFNPANPAANYLGDLGHSINAGENGSISVTVPAGAKVVLVVHEIGTIAGCPNYTFTVTNLPCTPACPPGTINGSIGQGGTNYPSTSGTETGRLSQNGVDSSCASPKTTPGLVPSGSFAYDSYRFTNANSSTACVTFTFPQTCGVNQAIHPVAYLGSFSPANPTTNYLGDVGHSINANTNGSFSVNVPAGATVVLVVHEVGTIAGCPNYSFSISGLPCPQTFVVNSTADTNDGACTSTAGGCTLREAINAANAHVGDDKIGFNIGGAGLHTIRPTAELPAVTEALVIDGYTQPGSQPNTATTGTIAVPLIELDGSLAPAGKDGITINGGNSKVRGLVINRFKASSGFGRGIFLPNIAGNTGNVIEGCFIGTSADGASDLGNEGGGVSMGNASTNNRLGGTTPAARNLISGNEVNGVSLSSSNLVQGNLIGTDKTGLNALGNAFNGIVSSNGSNQIGGTTAEAANVIAFNLISGVRLNSTGNNTPVQRNSIFSNGQLGIDLGGDGVTPNDAGDSDTGANNLQNFPVISAALLSSGTLNIIGSLNSEASKTYTIEFFTNTACDASGNGEGQTFLGSAPVTTNGSGNAAINSVLTFSGGTGQFITATATDPNGNTSEFSQCVQTAATPAISIGDVTQSEGNTGTISFNFTVLLNPTPAATVTVQASTADGTATVADGDYVAKTQTLTFPPGTNSQPFSVVVNGDIKVESNETFFVNLSNAVNATISDGQGTGTINNDDSAPLVSNVQFSAANYNTGEGSLSASITVTRTGDTSGAVAVDFATSDVGAEQRTDYTIGAGTVSFAAGETSKTFDVLLVDDLYVEPGETLNLNLTHPTGGAVLGSPSTATLTIAENDSTSPITNPLDNADARFFVRQHFYDFLSRLPDQGGFDFWAGQITQCGSNQTCLNSKRLDVSNAFFFELEYQQTGAYVFRLYRAAFGNNQPFPSPDNSIPAEALKLPSYAVFAADRARVVGGVDLASGQLSLANAFVLRPAFLAKYSLNLDGPGFVDAILATIANDLGVNLASQRTALINLFNSGGRGAVLYRLADDNASNPITNTAFIDAEYNRAFVATQYFGYLRRDPDIGGFLFWLSQVNSAPLRNVAKQHSMVCSFNTSLEYQFRFSSVATHSNAECQ